MGRYPELTGKVAIVTGGSTGIGKAIARDLGREGVKVMINALQNRERAEQAVAEIRGDGSTVDYFIGNAAKKSDVEQMVRETEAKFGPVDILVNNAGGFKQRGPVWELSEEEWDNVIAANLKTAYLCTVAVLPGMLQRGWGRIINIASESGRMPVVKLAAHYSAGKAGMIGFTKHVALEVAGTGVTVNATAPATTWSERVQGVYSDDDSRKMIESKAPMGRLAQPEEQAGIVTFLCSNAASYMNGSIIDVAGGKVMI
ncbi:MAG TPA: 3-oxoacyl-ACP reductase family protein [Ktedonobacterales bacterium]|nr:3-oxoacyl-ACP reductase family protein [Ktedonobacterales bacterium]